MRTRRTITAAPSTLPADDAYPFRTVRTILAWRWARCSFQCCGGPISTHCTAHGPLTIDHGRGKSCSAGNSSLPAAERVKDLLTRMTYEEKAASLDTGNPAIERLGVASMQGGECTHGVAGGCGVAAAGSTGCPTSFPSGPALGATFDKDIWSKVGQTIGREARALNNQAIPDPDSAAAETSKGVPGLPPNGKSGIYFLDPNINVCLPRCLSLSAFMRVSPCRTLCSLTLVF